MTPKWIAALALAFSLSAALPAQAQTDMPDLDAMTNEQIVAEASALHPVALYTLSARLLGEGDGYQAAQWMYAGQIRYRFLLAVEGPSSASNEGVLFSALHETVGRAANEYIGGDVDEWIEVIAWALQWDEKTDNLVTSRTEHADAWQEVRAGLVDLMANIEDNRDEIPVTRQQNGLENR